jgi:tRNA-dihydrouridine synthase
MILRHAMMSVEYKGLYTGMREMRKHVAWYTTGYPGSAKLRNRVNEIENMDDLHHLLGEYQKHIENSPNN